MQMLFGKRPLHERKAVGTMNVNLKEICGNWDQGYVLDKHTLSSKYIGDNEHGHPQFETKRSAVGEALYQLKYRGDKTQATPLAAQVAKSIVPKFEKVGLIVPMPASNVRVWQPVNEVAKELGKLIKVPVFDNIIVKAAADAGAKQLKDMVAKEEKEAALEGKFTVNDSIENSGKRNVLLLDDLFDTGASMEAVTAALRTYQKIGKIFVAALTWR
jgi:predicted amidophosphoribosyltransferase